MKKYLIVSVLILVCLTVLIPFASEYPDGLETVAETFGVKEHEPVWKGLMPDYTLPTVDNPYLSTLLAGIFGVLIVLGVALLLGIAITKPDR
jgi:hypothetical protein